MRNERRRRPPRKASAPLIRRRRRERGRASAEGERKTARRRSRSRRGAARKLIDAIKRPFGRPASGHKQTGYEVCLRTCLCARLAVTVVPGRGRAHTHTDTLHTRAHGLRLTRQRRRGLRCLCLQKVSQVSCFSFISFFSDASLLSVSPAVVE